jgi:hypothetical protein
MTLVAWFEAQSQHVRLGDLANRSSRQVLCKDPPRALVRDVFLARTRARDKLTVDQKCALTANTRAAKRATVVLLFGGGRR